MLAPIQDALRLAARRVTGNPCVNLAIVGTLAVGIAGAAVGHALLQHIVRAPLPRPQDVARLGPAFMRPDGSMGVGPVRASQLAEIAAGSVSFARVVGVRSSAVEPAPGGRAHNLPVAEVTLGFFTFAEAAPQLGRGFLPEDHRHGASRVIVLSDRLWRAAFAGDPRVLGTTMALESGDARIVGVMAPGVSFPAADAWLPLREDEAAEDPELIAFGRLRSGATWPEATAEISTLAARSGRPVDPSAPRFSLKTLEEESRERVGVAALGLLGPPALLLLVVLVNTTSLLLSEAIRREREVGVKLALGAGRWRLVREMLVESLALALPAGLLALLSVPAILGVLISQAPGMMGSRLQGLVLGPETLAFTFGVTFLAPLCFAASPLLHALRADLTSVLHGACRQPAGAFGRYSLRDLLVVVQIAGALALVAWFASVERLFAVVEAPQWGFETRDLMLARLDTPREAAASDWLNSALEAARTAPGVSGAALADEPPLPGRTGVLVLNESSLTVRAARTTVSAGYFDTLRVSLLRGQAIDAASPANVAVVNESLARALWGTQDPLGRVLLQPEGGSERRFTVIGEAPDLARWAGLSRGAHRFYVPFDRAGRGQPRPAWLLARGPETESALEGRLRATWPVAGPGSAVTAQPFAVVAGRLAVELESSRFLVRLVGGIGLVTLAFAALGAFAVTREVVRSGTRELGIRAALGATPTQLVRLAFRQCAAKVLAGAFLGIGVMAFGMASGFREAAEAGFADPRTWFGVAAAVATALLGGYLPARRAALSDPVLAMRDE